jgi:hypothetical protein
MSARASDVWEVEDGFEIPSTRQICIHCETASNGSQPKRVDLRVEQILHRVPTHRPAESRKVDLFSRLV